MGDEGRPRILGGVFGLETPDRPVCPPVWGSRAQYLLSVRCALFALIETHRPKAAWLPSYLCGALLRPFNDHRVPVRYYPVDAKLEVVGGRWLEEIQPGDFAVVVHYFGFPNRSFPADEVTRRGALLIEDASQALFLGQQFPESEGIIYSPRKFLGVPDGGVFVARQKITMPKLAPPPEEWWEHAVEVSRMRRDFDSTGCQSDWFERFQRLEAEYPVGSYGASDLARNILERVDYAAVAARRRQNYAALLKLAANYAIFPELPAAIVPLGFPVRMAPAFRQAALRHLHSLGIYAPVHWPIGDVVPAEFITSHQLSLSTLTLICDQRYEIADMQREAGEFLAIVAAMRELSREKPPGDRHLARETRRRLDLRREMV